MIMINEKEVAGIKTEVPYNIMLCMKLKMNQVRATAYPDSNTQRKLGAVNDR